MTVSRRKDSAGDEPGFSRGIRCRPQSAVLLFNLELYPNGGNAALPDGFEMFDEAARIRNKGSAMMQVDASDRLSFSGFYETTQDRYYDSLYGLLGYRSLSSGADVSYQLRNGVSLFANYAWERCVLSVSLRSVVAGPYFSGK
jgi:hypothetical protein